MQIPNVLKYSRLTVEKHIFFEIIFIKSQSVVLQAFKDCMTHSTENLPMYPEWKIDQIENFLKKSKIDKILEKSN